jgi:tetratricopeptide (TPR) repeat protein
MAQRDVLRELVNKLNTDLILLITHGGDDSIIDGVGNPIDDEEISHWKLRGTPIIFNNSCSSWTITGNALLKAGARSLIATLWPVRNVVAAGLASKIGSRLHDENDQWNVLEIFESSIQELALEQPDAAESLAAYVFVGPPRSQLRTQPVVGFQETLTLLTKVFDSLHNVFIDLAVNGRPDVALTSYQAVSSALQRRFKSLIEKDEIPHPLPPPFQTFTILETDLIFARAAFGFNRALLSHLPYEDHDEHLSSMDYELGTVVNEMTSWEERHDRHLGRTEEEKIRASQESGVRFRAIGEGRLYTLMVQLVYLEILPFVSVLAEVHEWERAKVWLELARLMVTTPRDLSPDKQVSDQAIIRRVREGNLEKMRVYGSDEELSFDHLQDIDRPDLLNRFGIAYKRLRQYERALAFYEAARDLAEPGSKNYANAISNIANLFHEQGATQEGVTGLRSAFVEQEKLEDYGNAVVTAANMLRLSSLTGDVVDGSIITKALDWANKSESSALRVRMCSDLLGAQACYYASRGKHAEAVEITARIAEYLKYPFPPPAVEVHLNELVTWYLERGLFTKSLDLALRNAVYLEEANMHEVAARNYIAAAAAAVNAYTKTQKKQYVDTFLGCAARVGAALQMYPSLREADLAEYTANIWNNLTSIWSQVADFGDTSLAVKAYEAIKVWEPKRDDVAGELLLRAFNERNKDFIKQLADRGALSRETRVIISKDLHVTVETTTNREDKNSQLPNDLVIPDTVYSYWPLHTSSNAVRKAGSQMEFVAGVAVYPLHKDDGATVEETEVRVLRTDGQGTYLYKDVFGSSFIPYRTVFELAPGLLPIDLNYQSKYGVSPQATIRFGTNNCEIEIEARDNQDEVATKVWLCDVDLLFREVPDELLWGEGSPFAIKMPFEMYVTFLRLLSKPH